MSNKYDDIIDLPHFVSKNRKHMSNYDRAAQFAPFAALTGYGEQISEASRITQDFIELGEQERNELDYKISLINNNIKNKPVIKLRYFIPDKYKDGGEYLEEEVVVKRIDYVYRLLILTDNRKIDFYYINDIQIKNNNKEEI